jgi:DNA-binding response OmpR family regulator
MTTHAGARVLVVDDDEPIASVLERGLVLAGYRVDVALDGDAARARWRSTTYAVVILDVMLPGVDGITLCAEMRAGGDTAPVLLLTARDDPEIRAAGMAAGASAVMVKPFVYARLLEELGRLSRAG